MDPVNRTKKVDNLSDVVVSLKTPAQAEKREIFQNRENGKLYYKRFDGTVVDIESIDLKTINGETLLGSGDLVVGGDGYTYAEVEVSSAQIRNLGVNPITLIPALGQDKYPQYFGIFEFTAGSEEFDFDPMVSYINIGEKDYSGLSSINNVSLFSLFSGEKVIIEFNSGAINQNPNWYFGINQPIKMWISDGSEASLGNGTGLVKIWYKVRNFGTEL